MVQQVQKEALGQVLRVLRAGSTPTDKWINRIPVNPAQLSKRGLGTRCLTLSRKEHRAPARSVELARVACWRMLLRVQLWPPLSSRYAIRRNRGFKSDFKPENWPRCEKADLESYANNSEKLRELGAFNPFVPKWRPLNAVSDHQPCRQSAPASSTDQRSKKGILWPRMGQQESVGLRTIRNAGMKGKDRCQATQSRYSKRTSTICSPYFSAKGPASF